ncbi:MAG TPA: PP0621 family protein [Burkholderiales bacterium]|nr:PP0621 family protein [Burkholderiales bacterium]
MGRILVILLIVVLAVWLLRRALRPAKGDKPPSKPAKEGELVACARCGLNLPRSEAREAAGATYCSDEHARLGRS